MINNNKKEVINKYYTRFNKFNNTSYFHIEYI